MVRTSKVPIFPSAKKPPALGGFLYFQTFPYRSRNILPLFLKISSGKGLHKRRSALFHLPLFDPLPVPKTIKVVDEKGQKADNHGEIGCIFGRCENPQDNQNDVVGSIAGRVVRAPL